MWIPDYYQIHNKEIIADFIKSVSLGTIVSPGEAFPMATHIPMELEEDDNGKQTLHGHIAKENPHGDLFIRQPRVLVIFHSPVSHYISSSWYEKANAPTWNYMSVHLYGTIRILDETETWQSVAKLTERHEHLSENPVSLATLPNHVQRQLRGVTGFEISIEKTEAAFKLSQNRNDKDYQNIIIQLEKLNTPESRLMAKVLKERTPSS